MICSYVLIRELQPRYFYVGQPVIRFEEKRAKHRLNHHFSIPESITVVVAEEPRSSSAMHDHRGRRTTKVPFFQLVEIDLKRSTSNCHGSRGRTNPHIITLSLSISVIPFSEVEVNKLGRSSRIELVPRPW